MKDSGVSLITTSAVDAHASASYTQSPVYPAGDGGDGSDWDLKKFNKDQNGALSSTVEKMKDISSLLKESE